MSKQIEELAERILGNYDADVLIFSHSLIQEILDVIYHNTQDWDGSGELINRISEIYGIKDQNSLLENVNESEDEYIDNLDDWNEYDS